MKKLLIALTALPFMAGVAAAGQPQPLKDQQMDKVTAGFSSVSIADAEALVGSLGIGLTTTAAVSQVNPIATANGPSIPGTSTSEFSSTLFKAIAASQSSSVTATFRPLPIPGVSAP
jgi:hypothetical protein